MEIETKHSLFFNRISLDKKMQNNDDGGVRSVSVSLYDPEFFLHALLFVSI